MEKRLLEFAQCAIDEALPSEGERPESLTSAIRYAVGAGGKRIRPLIALGAAIAAGGKTEDAKWPAAAIEFLHNYTLIHDDLPAMDNDSERRGMPTVWVRFGEANAILAGDALQALAFKVAAKAPRNRQQILDALSDAAYGVVQGQVEDIEHSKDLEYIYTHKTADLFIAAAKMGALAANGDPTIVEKLALFAKNLGLAFQYQDDILDGDYPVSCEETYKRSVDCTQKALAALENLPGDTTFLKNLANKLLGRKI